MLDCEPIEYLTMTGDAVSDWPDGGLKEWYTSDLMASVWGRSWHEVQKSGLYL